MNMLDWPLFRHPPTAHLYVYCLLRALDRETGLDDGQLTFSRSKAAKATGLSEQEIRTAIFKLSQSGAIKVSFEATNLRSIVTICEWNTCRGAAGTISRAINQASTKLQPTSNQPPAPKKPRKTKVDQPTSEPPEYRQFTDAFVAAWKQAHEQDYPWGKGDGPCAAAAWRAIKQDLAAGRRAVAAYMACTEPFYAGHTMTKFSRDIARWVSGNGHVSAGSLFAVPEAGQVDIGYTPRKATNAHGRRPAEDSPQEPGQGPAIAGQDQAGEEVPPVQVVRGDAGSAGSGGPVPQSLHPDVSGRCDAEGEDIPF